MSVGEILGPVRSTVQYILVERGVWKPDGEIRRVGNVGPPSYHKEERSSWALGRGSCGRGNGAAVDTGIPVALHTRTYIGTGGCRRVESTYIVVLQQHICTGHSVQIVLMH